MGFFERVFNNKVDLEKKIDYGTEYEDGYEDGFEDGYDTGKSSAYGSMLRKEGSSEAGRELANHRWKNTK